MMKASAEFRARQVSQIRCEIHGPVVSDPFEVKSKLLVHRPDQYYSCGILYPTITSHELESAHNNISGQEHFEEDESEESDHQVNFGPSQNTSSGNTTESENGAAEDVDLSNQLKPSAVSISFLTKDTSKLSVTLFFATYEAVQVEASGNRSFKRNQQKFNWKVDVANIENSKAAIVVLKKEQANFIEAIVKTRVGEKGIKSITITLVNRLKLEASQRPDYQSMIFQPQISAKTLDGNFEPIETSSSHFDNELEELSFQYRNLKAYCRGHGCAGEWLFKNGLKTPYRLISNLMPAYEVPGTKPRTEPYSDTAKLNFKFSAYSNIEKTLDQSRDQIIPLLNSFVEDYQRWYADKLSVANGESIQQNSASDRISNRIKQSVERMKKGINFLLSSDDALKSFILANRAMWLQQCHVKLPERCLDEEFENPSNNLDTNPNAADRGWRPFQLAFVLMNVYAIPTSTKAQLEDAEIVDLIWFPTGGGKTEAYLGLAAFSIAYSRLTKQRSHSGTRVIMRYTLRLLTGQQFNRASTLICALEYLREFETEFGWDIENFRSGGKINIGLWVGQSLTPNTNKNAYQVLKKLRDKNSDQKNVFQVLNCPWCKCDLVHHTISDKQAGKKSYVGYDTKGSSREIIFKCRDAKCPMDELPVIVVDEQLYNNPPTLLIGTVDKFAQLSWKDECGRFLGVDTDQEPPNLIIQDELHLISGPLGSIVAHYEYLIRSICKTSGFTPKVIASTATIRSADSQVQNLFRSEVNIFPSPGFDYDDNYFSFQSDQAGDGRTYVGVFASATPSVITAERNLTATLLQLPKLIFNREEFFTKEKSTKDQSREYLKGLPDTYDEIADYYGTLVWYFNSIRELGYAKTLLLQDIAEHFKVLQRRYSILGPLNKIRGSIEELTSRADEEDISNVENMLNRPWRPFPNPFVKAELPVDVLLATNMISVGFDIDRLGLMLITGQPKNTAEYIQASSRVGRGKDVAGLVYCLYNHSRSRDRSHFENFYAYHQALYKNVEPTSITPLAPKARERALPSLVIGIARQVLGIKKPSNFTPQHALQLKTQLNEYLVDAQTFSSKIGSDNVENEIDALCDLWLKRIKFSDGEDLTWGEMGSNEQETDLLKPYGQISEANALPRFELLMSMRNVDGESRGEISMGTFNAT